MIRARTGRRDPSAKNDTSPIADEIRLAAVAFKADRKDEYAAGMAHAADMVDAKAHLLRGVAFVDALDRMLEARLEAFVGDVAAAVRDAGAAASPLPAPIDLPPPAIRARPRKSRGVLEELEPRPVGKLALATPPTPERLARDDSSKKQARGVLLVLAAVAQHMPRGVDRAQLSILTSYKRSTRDLYVQQGIRAGWLAVHGSQILATDAGVRELGPSFERLPTGDALLRHWLAELPEGERKVLAYVVRYYPHPAPRERIGEAIGYKRSTRDLYVQRLERRRLLESTGAGHVVAAPLLFDPPEPAAAARGSR